MWIPFLIVAGLFLIFRGGYIIGRIDTKKEYEEKIEDIRAVHAHSQDEARRRYRALETSTQHEVARQLDLLMKGLKIPE